ncbi:ATP-dependent nuclease [Aminobacter ciceronei]|uniref:Energy-coupling factor transporter ATP-binding protein EcfA2 n=4 Tax=Phyllobacteriaceae TaxID=69277 RepID=A0ABR6C8C8_9HYPH|nr:ATP-binding protein [Aminobacter ciceronei]MBA8907493.1 energy-coupling factor transporter ATP-binding protein EcfA2 [Aminobacter ciceronei]MBA9021245.1 energy-coupling factor transporter ATP-binding protein EcfA2 [Aminobacter ciceronei]
MARIVHIKIESFRGIRLLEWIPSRRVNCLIGPGDSCKTTILDAIELALTPRSYLIADDSDFFDLDVEKAAKITVTLAGLPAEFKADDRYGLHLRGWNEDLQTLEDEPGDGLEDALSIRVTIDSSLEPRWSLFNERIGDAAEDPPALRYKDAKALVPSRLGSYADRHLGWGRQSILTRFEEAQSPAAGILAKIGRDARSAFSKENPDVFKETVAKAKVAATKFAVHMRGEYKAELDIQGLSISSGGISLHDDGLALRNLGTGSSRLVVSALQYDGGDTITIVDELEHGLEPHRIARLVRYLKKERKNPDTQVFLTSHSPVVIREAGAEDIHTVRSKTGTVTVSAVTQAAVDLDQAQRHVRASPDAFLARRIIVGEGRTELGLLRGFDAMWTVAGRDSFAFLGVAAVDGTGNSSATALARHLLKLGYDALVLLDRDDPAPEAAVAAVKAMGGRVVEWPDDCSTEERMFLDLPWPTLQSLVAYAEECVGSEAVLARINNVMAENGLAAIPDLSLPDGLDTAGFRWTLGKAAKGKKNQKKPGWFKEISRGERVAEIVFAALVNIPNQPFAKGVADIRGWVDG